MHACEHVCSVEIWFYCDCVQIYVGRVLFCFVLCMQVKCRYVDAVMGDINSQFCLQVWDLGSWNSDIDSKELTLSRQVSWAELSVFWEM